VTPDAFRLALEAFMRRRPFRPFIIEFHSGRRLLIEHPEALLHRGQLLHFLSPGEGARNYVFDSSSVSLVRDVQDEDERTSAQ
jgi:hypothetical protein